jgi:hypothetical protein
MGDNRIGMWQMTHQSSSPGTVEALASILLRCRTVLAKMADENEGAIFKRWPVNHEPLRADAKNLVPLIDEALVAHHMAFLKTFNDYHDHHPLDAAAKPGITGHQYRRARYEEPAATPTEPLRDALDWLVNCVECEVNLPGTTTVFQLRLAKAKEALAAPAQPVAATPPRYIVDGLPELPDDDADFTPYLARKIIAKYQEILRGAAQPSPDTCGTCMGSGYSNHPDSGEVCQACKGQGVSLSSTPLCTPSPQDQTR